MKTRPKSITFISWFLIITSVISIISTAFTYDTPEVVKIMELSPIPIILQYIMMVVGMTITISCSVLMLKAKSIGRIVYVGWTTLSLIIGLFMSPVPFMMLPGVLFFAVVTFFLFRPKANEYFKFSQEVVRNDS